MNKYRFSVDRHQAEGFMSRAKNYALEAATPKFNEKTRWYETEVEGNYEDVKGFLVDNEFYFTDDEADFADQFLTDHLA